jgi:hypothetical protein
MSRLSLKLDEKKWIRASSKTVGVITEGVLTNVSIANLGDLEGQELVTLNATI